jgi:hypothetical protein
MKTLAGLIFAASACLLLSCAHPQRALSAEPTNAATVEFEQDFGNVIKKADARVSLSDSKYRTVPVGH